MKKLLMFLVAGTMVFGACKKDEDEPVATTPDTTKPTAEISSPADGTTLDIGTDIGFAAIVKDNSNLKSYTYDISLGGAIITTATVDVSGVEHAINVAIPTTGMAKGDYTISLVALDASGNLSAVASVGVTLKETVADDKEKPVLKGIVITVPLPSGGNKMQYTFDNKLDVEVTDNVGLKSIVIELWNMSITPNEIAHTMTINKADMTDPKFYKENIKYFFQRGNLGVTTNCELRMKATDEAGNVGENMRVVIVN